jgi:DnaJ-class molecular chaperone
VVIRRNRSLLTRFHPDKVASLGADVRAQAEIRTKDLNLAYETLRDPERRKAYDETLRAEQHHRDKKPPRPIVLTTHDNVLDQARH